MAGMILIHQSLFKFDPKSLIGLFLDLHLPLFAIRFFNQNNQFFCLYIKLIVKNVLDHIPVDLQQSISRFNPQLLCDTSGLNLFHDMFMLFHL